MAVAINAKTRRGLFAMMTPVPLNLCQLPVTRVSFEAATPTKVTEPHDAKHEAKLAYWRERYRTIDGPRRRAARKAAREARKAEGNDTGGKR